MPSISLPIGTLKKIWVDRAAFATGQPGWAIEHHSGIPEDKLYEFFWVRSWSTVIGGPSQVEAKGSLEEPLYHSGPYLWLETRAGLNLEP